MVMAPARPFAAGWVDVFMVVLKGAFEPETNAGIEVLALNRPAIASRNIWGRNQYGAHGYRQYSRLPHPRDSAHRIRRARRRSAVLRGIRPAQPGLGACGGHRGPGCRRHTLSRRARPDGTALRAGRLSERAACSSGGGGAYSDHCLRHDGGRHCAGRDGVVLHSPAWPNVGNAARLRGAQVDELALTALPDGGFRMDFDRLDAMLK